MGLLLYTLVTRSYFLAISISALFSSKARKFKNGRKDIFIKLKKDINENPGDYLWIHCASLGEFEQGRPLIEAIKSNFPSYKILLTFFSPSGYEIRKNYDKADLIYYLPEDSPKNARRFLDLVQPKMSLFVKYEFWYFFLKEIHERNIPLVSVSSIFRNEQLFFKAYGNFYRKMLLNFSHFFVQDDISAQLLNQIGIKKVSVAGDTRFDRVQEISKRIKDLPEINDFKKGKKVLVAGSIWKEDLQVLVPLATEFRHIKLIIAPHELRNSFIEEIKQSLPDSSRYSKNINNENQVLIIDNIGLLASLYKVADYAFIGGAFGKGLHNILEAATFGMPIFFGNKNYKKFREAVSLIKQGGAFPVANYEALKQQILYFEQQPEGRIIVGQICKSFVAENTGATDKILDYSKKLLKV